MPIMMSISCKWCGNPKVGRGGRFCNQKCASLYMANGPQIPTSNANFYNTFLKLTGDWIIASDWHIPCYDEVMATRLLTIAKKFGIKKIIIPGDFLDNASFRAILVGKILPGYKEVDESAVLDKAGTIIRSLLKSFKEIVMLPGNHDDYLISLLHGKIKREDVYKMMGVTKNELKRVKISSLPFCELNETWHITHPKSYSQTPCSVPRRLGVKYRRSIISAHGHHYGLTPDQSGRDVCIESGGMFDYRTVSYKWLTDTCHPQWVSGFWIIKNNKPYGFSNLTTDWDFWFNRIKIK